MEINFDKIGSSYETTFVVNDDFNIHLERNDTGTVVIELKTAGDKFARTHSFDWHFPDFDYDFTGYVYPKSIKIISYVPIIKAYVTERA